MTYTHKMNEKQYKHKVAFSYYYEPKEFNVSLRVRVDANQILKKIKDAGGDIIYDYNSILKSLPATDYDGGDAIDWIKLSCYRKEKKELLNGELLYQSFETRKQKLEELFNKYFVVTGNYMKTIKFK